MIRFFKFTIIWISQNLAIPFWTIGHIHLMTTIYDDVVEILVSFGMNIIVFIGFCLNWLENRKIMTVTDDELEILEEEIKENIEWLALTENGETLETVECIGIENLEAILTRFFKRTITLKLK